MFSSCINSLTAIELLYKNTVSYDEEHFNFNLDMLDKKRINELQHQLNYLNAVSEQEPLTPRTSATTYSDSNAVFMTDVSETTFAD